MADETTRIINLTEATETDSGMYFVTDSLTGTKKLSIETLIDSSLTEEMAAAPASFVGANKSDISALQSQMETKANVDGLYESMTVGNAEQLVSTVFTEDSVPYLFRTSGGSIDIGDREYDEIVGGSVVWNQLLQDVNFSQTSNWRSLSSSTISIANNECTIGMTSNFGGVQSYGYDIPVISGHKYLVLAEIKADSQRSTVGFGLSNSSSQYQIRKVFTVGTSYSTYAFVGQETTGTIDEGRFMLYDTSGSDGVTLNVKNVNAIDLTTFFGSSTIPDYIYSLEQSTAGSGVAWLKKYFPKLFEYHEYDAGTLKSVEGLQSHDMVGFNQWDEETITGYYSASNGQYASANNQLCSQNFTHVLPNTQYCFGKNHNLGDILYYDADKNFISADINKGANFVFTTPTNCHFIQINLGSTYGNTYHHDICINLSNSGYRNGEYEPHVKHSYPLDSTLTLRGTPKLDANNSLYYDGDTYEADGTVTRRYGVVDLGTLSWSYETSGATPTFLASISSMVIGNADIMCTKYPSVGIMSWNDFLSSSADKAIASPEGNSSAYVMIHDSAYTSASAFKTAMSGVYLIYELATPTTETADPYTNPQIVDDWGTEEYVTDCLIPVGHETKYAPNLRAKLEMLPDSPNGDGDYIVRQSNGQNAYAPLVIPSELPNAPTTDGTYVLKCTVSDGQAALSWEVEE